MFKSRSWGPSSPLTSDSFQAMSDNDSASQVLSNRYGYGLQVFTTDADQEVSLNNGTFKLGSFNINVHDTADIWLFCVQAPTVKVNPGDGSPLTYHAWITPKSGGIQLGLITGFNASTTLDSDGYTTPQFSISGKTYFTFSSVGAKTVDYYINANSGASDVLLKAKPYQQFQAWIMCAGKWEDTSGIFYPFGIEGSSFV